jgi:3-methyladenine DNA glycosylase AlkD
VYEDIIGAFRSAGNAEKAAQMAAYMKNKFAYLGIAKPERAELEKEFLKEAKKKDIEWDFINMLWGMEEREFQYFAMSYIDTLKKKLRAEDLGKIKALIVSKSWWDTVDYLAAAFAGELCAKHLELIPEVSSYADSPDIWLKRTAILFQLKYKGRTDKELLASILDRCCGTKEFFLNKGIGWALREYSKTDPQWVREYIGSRKLHTLSVREGSKYI